MQRGGYFSIDSPGSPEKQRPRKIKMYAAGRVFQQVIPGDSPGIPKPDLRHLEAYKTPHVLYILFLGIPRKRKIGPPHNV